ncbi:MAG: hypothetical protein R3338_14995, partial [Thermoanaerobaculia bacterium]|nr:hypothetical protein [Thermoanaerobaculia bacterium]
LLDREGNVLTASSEADYSRHAVISPDGDQAATTAFDVRKGTADIWIHDLERNLRTRFTFEDATEDHPIWSPDGSTVYYAGAGNSADDGIYRKQVGGTGAAELLFESDSEPLPTDVSPDGQQLLFNSTGEGLALDFHVLDLNGERESRALRATPFVEGGGVFSPDGRWVAYFSNDSEAFHVYVSPYPDLSRRWQVSTVPGVYHDWIATPEGEEIVYLGIDGIVRAVKVSTEGDSLQIGTAEELFKTWSPEPGGARYSVSADGQRFLAIPETRTMTDASTKLILNWPLKLGNDR